MSAVVHYLSVDLFALYNYRLDIDAFQEGNIVAWNFVIRDNIVEGLQIWDMSDASPVKFAVINNQIGFVRIPNCE